MQKRDEILSFLRNLREEILQAFESLEGKSSFERKPWNHKTGGGGEMAVLRGNVFEKAAVNWSGVEGPQFPLQGEDSGPFFATGVSLITHMQSPHAPTVHMNLRYIETKNRAWLGGGYDLTPMGFPYEEDTQHFHKTAQEALDPLGTELYPLFSEEARKYFFIPHRNKERGVGGLFFDHYHTDPFEKGLEVWKAVGKSFLPAIIPIYQKRALQTFSEEEKLLQLEKRAHYAEFNLVYDRGTKFGFLSGGNVEAILCSMPPLASW
ncbi:MAG: oxygen-dependent coproporphyrinogen oxidase [Rhabdochlamydiaceae bacterium]|nr:oxygen-dependent coproporphyrinogen oxidase [Rhabdochlamydiaceae bacterium]